MGFLRKDMVMDTIREDMETTLACYQDEPTKEVIRFCYGCMERAMNELPQYRIDSVVEVE